MNILQEKQAENQVIFTLFPPNYGTEASEQISQDDFIRAARDGRWKTGVLTVREAVRDSDEHKASKKALASVSLSVQCLTRAEKVPVREKLIAYNYLLQVDNDLHADTETVKAEKKKLSADPHIVFAAISPSGDGVKGALTYSLPEWAMEELSVLLNAENPDDRKINETFREIHRAVHQEISNYLLAEHGIKNDPAVKDPFRICFVLYDSDIYYNPEAVPLALSLADYRRPVIQPAETDGTSPNGIKTITLSDNSGKLEKIMEHASQKVRNAPPGERHPTLISMARWLGGYIGEGLEETQAAVALLSAIRSNPNYSQNRDAEFQEAIRYGLDKGKKNPLSITQTEYLGEILPEDIISIAPKETESEDTGYESSLPEIVKLSREPEREDCRLLKILLGGTIRTADKQKWRYSDNGLWKKIADNDEALEKILDILGGPYKKAETILWRKQKEETKKLRALLGMTGEAEPYDPKHDPLAKHDLSDTPEVKTSRNRRNQINQDLESVRKKIYLLKTRTYHTKILHFLNYTGINPDLFNQNTALTHFSNGVYDENTDEFRPARQDDYLSVSTGHDLTLPPDDYDPAVGCPQFYGFVQKCLSGFPERWGFQPGYEKDLMKDFQYILAACFSAEITNFGIINVGEGNNGKSLTFSIITEALGRQGYSWVNSDDITLRGDREANLNLYSAINARLLVLGDFRDQQTLGSTWKNLINSGENKKVRAHYQLPEEFQSKWVVVGHANTIMRISEDTRAMRDRTIFFPWLHEFPSEERQNSGKWKKIYLSEMEGILQWMVFCVRKWKGRQHIWSDTIQTFSGRQFQKQRTINSYREWLENGNYEVRKYEKIGDREVGICLQADAYHDYEKYCEDHNIRNNKGKIPCSADFSRNLPASCYTASHRIRDENGRAARKATTCVFGLVRKPDAEPDNDDDYFRRKEPVVRADNENTVRPEPAVILEETASPDGPTWDDFKQLANESKALEEETDRIIRETLTRKASEKSLKYADWDFSEAK